MSAAGTSAYAVAAATPDPELPVVTIEDLGILRAVDDTPGGLVVTVTPTYSGCPALAEIAADVRARLNGAGFATVTVRTCLSPPWTTDWITPDGHRKLAAAGIAPPPAARGRDTPLTSAFIPLSSVSPAPAASPARAAPSPIPLLLTSPPSPPCPQCGSTDTECTADFSGTACKSLHRCTACREPFEAVKPL